MDILTSRRNAESRPLITIAVLTWGDHLALVQRCLHSVWGCLGLMDCEILVAANAPSDPVREWLAGALHHDGIHRLMLSRENLFKSPMMRHVIEAARGEYLWWF